jgi:chromosome segregation ATPase
MKLRSLHLSQWRQFRDAFTIDGLDDGINLFVGPNESGKSTLVGAIQAAFFERHKSGSVTHYRPWGDSSAEPAISLVFDWQDTTWSLDKRFLGHPRCDLDVGGTHYSADEAEDKLAKLFGYTYAGRGVSKAEHHGIPGLLWVRQGSVQEIHEPVEHAGRYLQAALGEDLGAVASSGDWLLARVDVLRGELLTPTGRATGDYKKAAEALQAQQEQLAEIDMQVDLYREKVDTLADLQEKRKADASKPWLAQRKQAGAAQEKLDEIAKLQRQQRQAQQDFEDCKDRQQLLRNQLDGFDKAARQLVQREQAKAAAQTALDECKARQASVEARQKEAREASTATERVFKQARERARCERLQAEQQRLGKESATNRATGDKLAALQRELQQQRAARQQNAIDADAVKHVRQLQGKLDKLQLRKEVAATRIEWKLARNKSLSVGDEDLTGEGERLLLEAAEIAIPGTGTLRLTPGGKDVAKLARDEAQLASDRATLLADLGINDVAEGEARVQTCVNLDADIERIETRMNDLAPEGIEALKAELQAAETKLAQLAEDIEACPAVDPEVPDEAEAEQARDAARDRLAQADTAWQRHRESLGLASQALASATDEWQWLKTECEAPERREQQQQASRDLVEFNAKQQALQQSMAERQAEIDAAQPDVLADDVERLTRSAQAQEDAANERIRGIDRLQAQLQALGAQGLEDQRNELAQQVERLERRHDELARRARALDLLRSRLGAAHQALTLKLQAPLQKHIDHYLQRLFPGAGIDIDENLSPTVLARSGQRGDIKDLSYGAREQLGLVSRLAYADLLQEAGQPTLLILDDALVHSDATRLAQMKRVLYDAAKRHQVLLFTCHPDNWNDLGVAARDLATLKVAAA